MNRGYGGGQVEMHNSKIENQAYLGPFDHSNKLNVNDIQTMLYGPDDTGPFYLDNEKRIELENDCETNEIETKKYTRAKLIDLIVSANPNLSNIRGKLKEIQSIALQYNIPIQFDRNKLREGWKGKPKGMLQVLWERGFIDPDKNVREYTLNGKKINKDSDDIVASSSLKQLITALPDFQSELTLLQFRAQQLGVQVRCSPKYHAEIAGEAIEFCWAFSKNRYRRHKLEDKRTKVKFISLVNKCQEDITKKGVRLFGRRLRRYILAYFAIEKAKEKQVNTDATTQSDQDDNEILNVPEMSCSLVERLAKKKKSHRNIADQEKNFMYYVLPLMKQTSRNIN